MINLNNDSANLEKIERGHLLNYKIYHILKSYILEGKFGPGTKLVESKLAKQMGVSRTPIREAIKCLATESFVKTIPGQGTFINSVTIKDLKEVLQVRGVLEGLAAKLAIKVIKKKEIENLEKIIEEMGHFAREKNIFAFSGCSIKFQEKILDISGNSQLIKTRNNVCDKAHRYRIISLSSPKRLKYSFEEHRAIFEAIREGDPDKVEKLCQLHTENVFKNVLAHTKKNKEEVL